MWACRCFSSAEKSVDTDLYFCIMLISANYSEDGGNRLNATVTVKTDYQQLMSKNERLLNHTRLLQAMVTQQLLWSNFFQTFIMRRDFQHKHFPWWSLFYENMFVCVIIRWLELCRLMFLSIISARGLCIPTELPPLCWLSATPLSRCTTSHRSCIVSSNA